MAENEQMWLYLKLKIFVLIIHQICRFFFIVSLAQLALALSI